MVGLSGLDSNKYRRICLQKTESQSPHRKIISQPLEIRQLSQTQKRLSDSEIKEVVAAYQAGKTTYELGEQYGCHRRTIVAALKRQGIVATKCKAQEKLDAKAVIELYLAYHTTAEIAKQFNVSPNAIIRCLRGNGIAIRNRWDYPRT